jgi:hypothetical protein
MSRFKGPRVKPLLIGQPKLPNPKELFTRLSLMEQIVMQLLERDNLTLGFKTVDGERGKELVLVDRSTLPPVNGDELTMKVLDEDVVPQETTVVP